MLSLKRGSEQDVESLIESMLRLIDYMHHNPSFKRNIFSSFSTEDLCKILKNLNDQNMQLRKVSCIFLCSILNNQENCEQFMQRMDLMPVNSKVTLNGVPERMSKYLMPGIFQKLNNVQPMDHSLCWYYTSQMAKDQLTNLNFITFQQDTKKLLQEFIDPLECIVGIVYYKNLQQIKPNLDQVRRSNDYFKKSVSPLNKENQKQVKRTEPISSIQKVEYQTDKQHKNVYDILRHRMSDNSRAIRSPNLKKTSQDWKSVSNDPKYRNYQKS